MKKAIVVFIVIQLSSIISTASATVYDLAADWSDTVNPNGPWSYLASGTMLSSTIRTGDNWSTPQKSWGEVAGWFKSNGTEQFAHDWQAGDIVTHTPSTNSQILWTAPENGDLNISGGVWHCRDIARWNEWSILLNGGTLTGGMIGAGFPDSRVSPFLFSAGSGGEQAVQGIHVSTGDIIELRMTRWTGSASDYAGVTMTITQVPEPATMVLLGLGGLILRRRK